MPFHSNLPAITYVLSGLAILYLSGFWLASILFEDREFWDLMLWTPLLGLAVVVIVLANLNYLGVPAKIGILAVLALSSAADVVALRKFLRRTSPPPRGSPLAFCLIGGSTALFLLPYVLYGAFPEFNDAVYYSSVADFVRDRSYFASAEPAQLYPWLAEMLLAQGGARMGAQYFLAALSTLLGVSSYYAFWPVTAIGVFLAGCGFWLLARTILQARVAAILALIFYSFNAAMVHEIASLNWLSQSVAFGPMFALIGCGLAQPRLTRRNVLTTGILLAALVSIYPEIVAFALVPILFAALSDLLRKRDSLRSELIFGALVLVTAVVLNPYTWYYSSAGVKGEAMASGIGFNFMRLAAVPGDVLFGLTGLHGYSTPLAAKAAYCVGVGFAAIALLGLAKIKSWGVLLFSASVYVALAFYQLEVRHFPYSFYKVFVYGYYVVPLCGGAGIAFLLLHRAQLARLAAAAAMSLWLAFAGLAFYRLTVTCYLWIFNLSGSVTASQYTQPIEELSAVAAVPKADELTLIVCPRDDYDRWVPYFFRKPVGDVFKSVYYGVIWNRPVPEVQQVDYLLTLRPNTSWKNERQVIFSNQLFAFSRAQTALVVTNDGFYDAEAEGSHRFHWMGQRGHILLLAPEQDTISIRTTLRLGPDGKPRHVRILLDKQPIRSLYLEQPDTPLTIPDLNLKAGSHDLVFETDEPPVTVPGDDRDLRLSIRDMSIVQAPPSSVNLLDSEEIPLVQGVTEDRWITSAGAEADLSAKPGDAITLQVEGEALSATAPGELTLICDGQTVHSQKIATPGPTSLIFMVSLKHPTGGLLHVRLLPDHTVSPAELKINGDTRQLGFRLSAIKVRTR